MVTDTIKFSTLQLGMVYATRSFFSRIFFGWLVVWKHGILWLSINIYWECHDPNWRNQIFQRGRLAQPPTNLDGPSCAKLCHVHHTLGEGDEHGRCAQARGEGLGGVRAMDGCNILAFLQIYQGDSNNYLFFCIKHTRTHDHIICI